MPKASLARFILASVVLAVSAVSAGPGRADFLWWDTPKASKPLALVIENNAKGGCWLDPEEFRGDVTRLLQDFEIRVALTAASGSVASGSAASGSMGAGSVGAGSSAGETPVETSLLVSALGHPTNNPVYTRRLGCVGVLSVRVSSITRSGEAGIAHRQVFDDQRLLVADDRLDRVLLANAREMIEKFSLRYARIVD